MVIHAHPPCLSATEGLQPRRPQRLTLSTGGSTAWPRSSTSSWPRASSGNLRWARLCCEMTYNGDSASCPALRWPWPPRSSSGAKCETCRVVRVTRLVNGLRICSDCDGRLSDGSAPSTDDSAS